MATVAPQLDLKAYALDLCKRAKEASQALNRTTGKQKQAWLRRSARVLRDRTPEIVEANARDLEAAPGYGLTDAAIDRLRLTPAGIEKIALALEEIALLADPIGEIIESSIRPNGLEVQKVRVPLGVVFFIYESRPNVTADAAALCVKSGNAVILRGGKEILRSTTAMVEAMRAALHTPEFADVFPSDAIQCIDDPDRRYITELLRLDQYVDMIIPRGGAALHRLCRDNATIPVITGGIGVCHAFIDATANAAHALDIVHNGKTQRPSVCNTLDTLLVHEAIAADFLPRAATRLAASGVVFKAESRAGAILEGVPGLDVTPAGADDFDTEWMALIMGVKVVSGLDEALDHIRDHGTGHSEVIVTEDAAHAERFTTGVDASAVFVNASTRFNDGGQLGLGAEIAVSTQKLHARGPMALEELTTYKWVVVGDGHVRP